MLKTCDKLLEQLRYLKAALEKIPAFRPDGLAPADLQALIAATQLRRAEVVAQETAQDGRAAERQAVRATLHDWCAAFHAQGASRFRHAAALRRRIARLPKRDRTFAQTAKRAAAVSALWATLPPVGAPPAPLTIAQGTGAGVTRAQFDAARAALSAAESAVTAAAQQAQAAQAAMRQQETALRDTLAAALAQGRSQFRQGAPQRELLDAIPGRRGRGIGSGGDSPPNP